MNTVTIGLLNKKRGNFKIQEKFAARNAPILPVNRISKAPFNGKCVKKAAICFSGKDNLEK